MEVANEFFGGLANGLASGINTALVGRIERFDSRQMKADVLPMVRNADGSKMSMLIEVPVSMMRAGGFVIKPPYKKGDLALVVFADTDIDNFLLTGRLSTRETNRQHSLDDAIVIGSILPFSQSLPSGYANDLVIGTEDFSSKIVMQANGNIMIDGNKVTIKGSNRTESW